VDLGQCRNVWRFHTASFGLLLSLMLLGAGVVPVHANPAFSLQQQEGSYSGGFSITFDSAPKQQLGDSGQRVYTVRPEAPLRGVVGIRNEFPDRKSVRVLLLLNYEQQHFSMTSMDMEQASDQGNELREESPLRESAEFAIEPLGERWFDFVTLPLDPGYYDMALIFVPDPLATQAELRYRTTLRPVIRASVYVQGGSPPQVDFPPLDPEARENDGYGEVCWLTAAPYSLQLTPGTRAKPGEDVTFFLSLQPHVAALEGTPPGTVSVSLALVAFMDDEVVPMNGEPAVFASAQPGYLSAFAVTITAPPEPGVYQFFIQQLPYPFVDVAEADQAGRVLVAESTQRVVLEVK